MPVIPVLFSTLAGALATLSLKPFGWWPFALLSTGLLYFFLRNKTAKQTFFIALAYSFGLFLSGVSWVYISIHEFGYISANLASLLTVLFCAFIALINGSIWCLYPVLHSRLGKSTTQTALIFSAVGLLTEQLRSWIFTGFPWLFIGYSQTESLLAGWAPIIGVYGISFIIYLSGAILSNLPVYWRSSPSPIFSFSGKHWLLFLTALCWLAGPAIKHIQWTTIENQPLKVSIIQANISQHDKWQPEHLTPTLDLYQKMSALTETDSDLILWPEAAIPGEYHRMQPFIRQLDETTRKANKSLITGIPFRDAGGVYPMHNSVIALGSGSGIYHKQRLVPFGEYVPLEFISGKIMSIFELPLSSMSPGKNNQSALDIGNWKSRPLICYEIVYPELTAKTARLSDVLITVSNDSWFGASIGPIQHLQMAQMRALENGRYLLRGTSNGVSAIVNHKGAIIASSKQFKQEVLSGNFYLAHGLTPWSAFGYWFIYWLSPAIFFIAWLMHKHRLKTS